MASPEPSRPSFPSLDTAALADPQASISAYYSLVFPNFTYFLQTLSVTIGRRCSPAAAESSSSSADKTQVDVDLGPLKSVSRLHARIEYEEEEERFVLVVVGRNGAWVDGVWSGSGSKVPLSERSQIQIAARTFHFVLPPPAAPEDSPTPSDEQDYNTRFRSPSVDIISHSPPSSLTSHSPPPPAPTPSTKPSAPPKPKPNSKKRKKTEPAPSPPKPPKPEVMPPKPQLTYSIMCYRAIKALGGKATLQDICGWMRDTFEWYKWNDEAGWENSVRHNLSSNRSFKKMDRCAGERGKGFFWSIEEKSVPSFEEQEARLAHIQQQQANGSMSPATGIKVTAGKSKKLGAVPSDPPLKRSVKAGGGPLPPPLTSTPLAMKSAFAPAPPSAASFPSLFTSTPLSHASSASTPMVKIEPSPALPVPPPPMPCSVLAKRESPPPPTIPAPTTDAANSTTAQSASFISSLPPSVCIPIIIGPVPSSSSSSQLPSTSSSSAAHLPTPPIVLHENTLILNPSVFSHLTPEQLKELEALGAQKALEILQSYIVRFLKERIRGEKDGARGRGRGRSRTKRGGAGPGRGGPPAHANGSASSPFTTAPLPPPNSAALRHALPSGSSMQGQEPTSTHSATPSMAASAPPAMVPVTAYKATSFSNTYISPSTPPPHQGHTSESPIIVVDDVDEHDGRAMKRRRLDVQDGTAS